MSTTNPLEKRNEQKERTQENAGGPNLALIVPQTAPSRPKGNASFLPMAQARGIQRRSSMKITARADIETANKVLLLAVSMVALAEKLTFSLHVTTSSRRTGK